MIVPRCRYYSTIMEMNESPYSTHLLGNITTVIDMYSMIVKHKDD